MCYLRNVICGTAAFFLAPLAGFCQHFWVNFEGRAVPVEKARTIMPEVYRIQELDEAGLKAFLAKAGATPETALELELPQPDGNMRIFKIWQTSVMEAGLQQRFPEIRTYTAVARDNPDVSAKIDFTPKGFHALVFDAGQTFLIDPYSQQSDGYYLVYYKKDYRPGGEKRMVCELDQEKIRELHLNGLPENRITGNGLPDMQLKQNGSTRKIYRLALSCTGEYAVAVDGPTPSTSGVLSAMVTTMNRVNGIYEREIAVSMELIGNEDNLIYLDPATDPFTANNNGSQLLDQNQINTTNVIGDTAFDIGHIFSTGGGGIAQLGCVCYWDKAKGVTGSSNPVGDAYDVDYVAHEMGHQFGANHTFNDCSGNENPSTAFEPGSGSTIMAYAGICGAINNLQGHSDAYFHAASLWEIGDFLLSGGGSCGTAETGITPPVLTNIAQVYFIPAQTPFELIGPAAITSGGSDSLLYNWEQWNLGNLQVDEDNSDYFTSGPSFRSFTPSANASRVFPEIDSVIVSNTDFKGERLPMVARDLQFRLTARNLLNGWGAFTISDSLVTIHVAGNSAPFKVTSPDNGGLTFSANSDIPVTWNVAGSDAAPVSCAHVDIFLSADGGYTYPYTLATNVPNNGSAVVTLPDVNTDRGRIKIKGHDNIFFDISDNDFKTDSATGIGNLTTFEGLDIYPNPATDRVRVRLEGTGTLDLVLYNNTGVKVWAGKVAKEQVIPTAAFARGIYLLQITDSRNGSRAVRKLILQ